MVPHASPDPSRRTLLIVLLAAGASAAAAEAPPNSPPPPKEEGSYAWVEIGAGVMDDIDVKTRANGSFAEETATWSMDPGFAVYGGFGQKLAPWAQVGVLGGFLYNGVDEVELPGGRASTLDAELLQVPILAFAEFEPPLKSPLRPFAGASFGTVMSWLNIDETLALGSGAPVAVDGSSTEFTFAYSFAGGLRWRLRGGAHVALTYRFIDADSPTWSLQQADSDSNAGSLQADNLRSQTLTLGFYLPF